MSNKTNTPSISEFADWNDDKENKAINELADLHRVRHIIKNGEYWALIERTGHMYKLPLSLTLRDFDALNVEDLGDGVEALKRIIRAFGGEQADSIENEPVQVLSNMLTDYGAVVARTQGATLGK